MKDLEALRAAYLAGFNASAEGFNGEYPFYDSDETPLDHPYWVQQRDEAIAKIVEDN